MFDRERLLVWEVVLFEDFTTVLMMMGWSFLCPEQKQQFN